MLITMRSMLHSSNAKAVGPTILRKALSSSGCATVPVYSYPLDAANKQVYFGTQQQDAIQKLAVLTSSRSGSTRGGRASALDPDKTQFHSSSCKGPVVRSQDWKAELSSPASPVFCLQMTRRVHRATAVRNIDTKPA